MLALPIELLDAVFCFLSPAELAAAARTNAFIYPVAVRRLYRHLAVAEAPGHASPSVILTLAARPDVAAHTRSFSVCAASLLPELNHQLAAALRAMTALVSLEIFSDTTESWVLPGGIVSPQLQHFACSFPFDACVAAFLGKAPTLESIHLGYTESESPPLTKACLPRLAEFTGSSSAAVAIVPGRPVENIFIISGDLTEEVVPVLAKSTALVTVLSITTSSAPVSMLHTLGQHLPHIVYLRITTSSNLPAPPTTIFYEQIAGALAFFPNLQSFELSGMYWSSYKQTDDQQRVWQSPQPLAGSSEDNVAAHDEGVDIYSNATDFFFS